jgi:hypothetical protein
MRLNAIVLCLAAIAGASLWGSSAQAADPYVECVGIEDQWAAEANSISAERARRLLAVVPKRCQDLKKRMGQRLSALAEAPPPKKPTPAPAAAVCQSFGADATQVSITPHKTNFPAGDAPRLQKLLGCKDFKVIYGKNSLYPNVPIDVLNYLSPLRIERLRTLLHALNSMNVFMKYICIDTGANSRMKTNMFLLAGRGPGDWENLGPITPDMIEKMGAADSESAALEALGDHACRATSSTKDRGF